MSAHPETARPVPDVIGHFRIAGVLGEGGMGTVYLGERIGDFEQRVAIKLLHAQVKDGSSEEDVLTSLDHPGIIRLLDRGKSSDGTPYLVTEYVAGEPIDRYCAQRDLPVISRVKLLLQAADAIAYAHSKLVIHADLKPQNILVTASGEVKLLDFGIAQPIHDAADRTASHFTPAFSSPEQQFGQKLTAASDIFSFGSTGRAVVEDLLPSFPPLAAILRKATMREPEERYRSIRDLAADLTAFTEERPVGAYRIDKFYVARMWIRRNRITAFLISFFILVIACSTIGVGIETARAAHRRKVAQTRLRELATLTGKLQGDLFASLPAGADSDPARAELIAATVKTLEKLAQDDQQDPVMRGEIAEQFRHLAQLQQQRGDSGGAAVSLRSASALSQNRAR